MSMENYGIIVKYALTGSCSCIKQAALQDFWDLMAVSIHNLVHSQQTALPVVDSYHSTGTVTWWIIQHIIFLFCNNYTAFIHVALIWQLATMQYWHMQSGSTAPEPDECDAQLPAQPFYPNKKEAGLTSWLVLTLLRTAKSCDPASNWTTPWSTNPQPSHYTQLPS